MNLPQLPGQHKRPPQGAKALIVGPHSPNIDENTRECLRHVQELGYLAHGPYNNLRAGLYGVLDVDFLVVLPGWEFDKQANVEVSVAKALDLPVLDCGTLEPRWLP